MKKLLILLLTISGIQLLLSCSSNVNVEDLVGAVFVSPTDYSGNDFENDSARIELLPDSVCIVRNLSFTNFDDSDKWPQQFTGRWYIEEDTRSLIISYGKRVTSFEIVTFDIDGDLKPIGLSLRYYVGDPDEMIYHVLIEESNQPK